MGLLLFRCMREGECGTLSCALRHRSGFIPVAAVLALGWRLLLEKAVRHRWSSFTPFLFLLMQLLGCFQSRAGCVRPCLDCWEVLLCEQELLPLRQPRRVCNIFVEKAPLKLHLRRVICLHLKEDVPDVSVIQGARRDGIEGCPSTVSCSWGGRPRPLRSKTFAFSHPAWLFCTI